MSRLQKIKNHLREYETAYVIGNAIAVSALGLGYAAGYYKTKVAWTDILIDDKTLEVMQVGVYLTNGRKQFFASSK